MAVNKLPLATNTKRMHLQENKVIDEARQGEAIMVETKTEPNGKKMYLESYGCAMNFSDSEIVASIMTGIGYQTTKIIEEANVIFLNTCAIRDNAELRVWARLREIKKETKNSLLEFLVVWPSV